ncbi:MAG TPA: RHS repeat-associated core domain-containing protein [Flavobacteriales bacterium]|nr:RHS repeat-associated core domain-containing protein [Flavobacteriales bacterium]
MVRLSQEYKPFGSLLPGRNYSSDSYRYGFQGQEKDNEMHGANGTSHAFEYRMHDARVGRFLSIDPLASKFAYNSPYAFSENRVIDGVELEGKEYVHYYVFLKADGTLLAKVAVKDFRGMNDDQTRSVHGMPSKEFYKKYSESFGPAGPGIEYTYFAPDGKGGFNRSGHVFDPSGGATSHGIYYGAGGPSELGPQPQGPPGTQWAGVPGSERNRFTYEEPAIDEVDALARTHDMNYDKAGAKDWHSDPRGIPADLEFIEGLERYVANASQEGYVDQVTGRPPSQEAVSSAKSAATFFRGMAWKKFISSPTPDKPAEPKP